MLTFILDKYIGVQKINICSFITIKYLVSKPRELVDSRLFKYIISAVEIIRIRGKWEDNLERERKDSKAASCVHCDTEGFTYRHTQPTYVI